MVMKKNAMRKNLIQSILKSLGRYIAIVMIIALGASMFVGLLMTKSDMVATGQKYMDEQNMFDLRLISTYGWGQEQLTAISQLEGVVDAEGVIYIDAVARAGTEEEDSVYRFYTIPEKVNRIALRGGRMPRSADECLIDGYHMDDSVLGTQVRISADNFSDTLDTLVYDTYTVVGYVASPLYMDMNRGTTSVGNGSLANCFYVPQEGMDADYFAEICITIPGDYEVYTKVYNDAMKAAADALEQEVRALAEKRFEGLRSDALESYREGRQEYLDGLNEYKKAKYEAELELEDAYNQLLEAQQQIAENEQKIPDAEKQIASGKAALAAGEQELKAGREEYESMKSMISSMVDPGMEAMIGRRDDLIAEISRIDAEIAAIDAQIGPTVSPEMPGGDNEAGIDFQIAQLEGMIDATDGAIRAAEYTLSLLNRAPELNALLIAQTQSNITNLQTLRDEYVARIAELEAQREQMEKPEPDQPDYSELLQKKEELIRERALCQTALDGINLAIAGADEVLSDLMDQFKDAEQQIIEGEKQLAAGRAQIAQAEKELEEGKKQLEEAKIQLAEGWIEYEDGKAEAEREFAEAESKLAEGKAELDDGLAQITDMQDVDVFILDRNTNVGYGSLNSASDIVQGVSRVFPAFFLLVAALVCITTMTRMIDEERTQIGTLKALGYSNGAIISKYLIYAGSGAIVGCGLGVFVGSMAFPTILWQAYKIMLYITDGIVLRFDMVLCGIVVSAYTAVMLFVTWYCCRKTLKEVPAELIRPKAPEVGRKILLERLPFWNRISFLNKVTIRNIFRYRQRLAMMMVGIGGCTALLVTGFGLRDSIVNVVDYQFEEVTTYDLQVYFSEGQTEGDRYKFLGQFQNRAEHIVFYHQQSIELEANDQTKELSLMAGDSDLQNLIDFHKGEEKLSMPRINEVLLSSGVAENLSIDVGDLVLVRNADLQQMELKVSGIYDNHVNNFAIIIPETIESQWGQLPEIQMALIKAGEGTDYYSLGAEMTGYDGVMNVSVSEDFADMVRGMMDALDLVVWVVVVCAGMLAAIVLYNLTNINITERIREIATIKVLGFNSKETGAYVFKENLSLTAIGSLFGLILGYFLLLFVMDQIKIDMVWFKALVMPRSYMIAIVLTMLAACIVDFIFYFKLEKINMAEALKSVE